MKTNEVTVIGAGIAGSEAAYQLAIRGAKVRLYEMRPTQSSPVHTTGNFAELVCSNSFKSRDPMRAQGLIKEELLALDSLIIRTALETSVEAGVALAVDRNLFSRRITETLGSIDGIQVIREAVEKLPEDGIVIVASGPQTHPPLWGDIRMLLGEDQLYFFDATSPIVEADSLDHNVLFEESRWGKGGGYLNAAMDKENYIAFREALLKGERYPLGPGEDYILFEGCLPVEELAERGEDTLRFGPLRPVGIKDPTTGKRPYAVVQLRKEDALNSAYSLVGFQTRLRIGEQEQTFRLIPGLQNAKFLRFGRMHRNDYVNSPRILSPNLEVKKLSESEKRALFLAGQITGAEGYVCAAATGLIAGINAYCRMAEISAMNLSPETCLGALTAWCSSPLNEEFKPTSFNYSMFTYPTGHIPKPKRSETYRKNSARGIAELIASRSDLFGEILSSVRTPSENYK